MAENYKAFEAAQIVKTGLTSENAEKYQDVLKRFPFFAGAVVGLNEEGMKLLELLPEYDTARKINKRAKELLGLTDKVTEDDEEESEEVEEIKPAKKEKPAKKSKKVEEPEDDEDDEEEEEKPVKKAKKKIEKKPVKKAKKEELEDEDDDDDFDFDDDEE